MKKIFDKLNIHNKKEFFKFIIQFTKFGVIGISNTLISLCIYYIFIFINKDLYLIGYTIGFFVSVLNSYYWNNKYVFHKTEKGNAKPLVKTFISYGFTFILSYVLLIVFVKVIGISEAIAPLLNLILTIPLNFLLNKYWAFK